MDKLGYTWYPKDWWTSDTFFKLPPELRYLFLEVTSMLYLNGGYWKADRYELFKRFGVEVGDKGFLILSECFIVDDDGFWTSESVLKRLDKNSLGGRKRSSTAERATNGRFLPNSPSLSQPAQPNRIETEKNIIEIGDISQKHFIIINSPYANEKKYRLWGVGGVGEFLEMNGSKWPRTDLADKFLRDKTGQPFNDFGHILNAYNVYIKNQFK